MIDEILTFENPVGLRFNAPASQRQRWEDRGNVVVDPTVEKEAAEPAKKAAKKSTGRI